MFCIAYWGGFWEKMCFLSNKEKNNKGTHCRNNNFKEKGKMYAKKKKKNGDSTLEYFQE